jgi:hypothetical protein
MSGHRAPAVCDAPVDIVERGCKLSLPSRMRGAVERADNFFTGKFQRFDLSRQYRIPGGRPARAVAISLKLFHAFLDLCFVID